MNILGWLFGVVSVTALTLIGAVLVIVAIPVLVVGSLWYCLYETVDRLDVWQSRRRA